VTGQVDDVKDIETVQVNGKERKNIEFELRDTNDDRMPCCLWERCADQLWTSKLQITNAFETSKLMINPALPEVTEFMNALPDDGLALTIVETPNDDKMVNKKEYWSNLQQKTIEELLITSEACNEIVTKVEAKFKLHFMVMDQTSKTKVMLLDTVASTIVPQSATKLLGGSFDEVSIIHSNIEENSMTSTTPLSKRSSDELESLPDLSSTSKKLCITLVKQEKIDGKLPASEKEIVVIKREKNNVEKKTKNSDSQTILAGTKEKEKEK
ncbi:unnamed protein product, partial [Thlaspi arvense]